MTEFSSAKIISPPSIASDVLAWREALGRWRTEERVRLNYNGSLYQKPEFTWVQRCFACHFVMLNDRMLMDHRTGQYTPEVYIEYANREFGGMDAIVLWHAYPNIGIDERNQFDFYRDAPGGIKALRELVEVFHSHDVRVFVNYNPWDTGTRREPVPYSEALAQIVGAIGADGVFLDTMRHGSNEFRQAMDQAKPGVVFESESSLPLEHIHDHHMSWAQWFPDLEAPGVLRNKWFEPRHMMHHTRRWERDHHQELHSAWMNGVGILVWENVFGSWNGWNARDRWLLRMMLPILRRFADFFSLGEWMPMISTGFGGVYSSKWSLEGSRLWTLISRRSEDLDAELYEARPRDLYRYFDLLKGVEVRPKKHGKLVFVKSLVTRQGIGALLAVEKARVDDALLSFLASQRKTFSGRTEDTNFPESPTTRESVIACKSRQAGNNSIPTRPAQTTLNSTFRNRECGTYGDAPFVNMWKPKPPLLHQTIAVERWVNLGAYAFDAREVTNQEYQEFLLSSKYQPTSTERFLAHWADGVPSAEQLSQPVVFVDLEDARAYARWADKRLPTEDEWQAALEQMPELSHGHVWNWTESEHDNGRTRFCILKGGSDYQAEGSEWYFDGGPQTPDFSAKFLLGSPSLNRRATIGFRCVVDLEEQP